MPASSASTAGRVVRSGRASPRRRADRHALPAGTASIARLAWARIAGQVCGHDAYTAVSSTTLPRSAARSTGSPAWFDEPQRRRRQGRAQVLGRERAARRRRAGCRAARSRRRRSRRARLPPRPARPVAPVVRAAPASAATRARDQHRARSGAAASAWRDEQARFEVSRRRVVAEAPDAELVGEGADAAVAARREQDGEQEELARRPADSARSTETRRLRRSVASPRRIPRPLSRPPGLPRLSPTSRSTCYRTCQTSDSHIQFAK